MEFLLGSTMEKVHIPHDLCGHIDGKSSIGRLGVFVHVSSGFIDSGFTGNVTLEIFNCSDKEFELYHGMSICQIVFETLTSPVAKPYGRRGNHYQGSEGTVLSKYEGL
jgi:dCTP deaminase